MSRSSLVRCVCPIAYWKGQKIVKTINEQVGPTDSLELSPKGEGISDWEFDLAVSVTINEAVQRFNQQVTTFQSNPVAPRPVMWRRDPLVTRLTGTCTSLSN